MVEYVPEPVPLPKDSQRDGSCSADPSTPPTPVLVRQVACTLERTADGLRCTSLSMLPLQLDSAAAQRLPQPSVVLKVMQTGGSADGARPVWVQVARHGVGGRFQGLAALFGPLMGTVNTCAAVGCS